MARTKPLIRFEIADEDIEVKCSKGHTTFALILQIRLNGAMTKRLARCTECGETEPIDG